jgi:hypothetical protein
VKRVLRKGVLFRMSPPVLMLLTVLGAVSALGPPLQVCLSKTEGGMACRCTATHTTLGDQVLDVDCSSRNLSTLPAEWQISQDPRSLDLSRNQLSVLVKGKQRVCLA